jgi:hypothetical protein
MTSAMAAGITRRPWSVADLLMAGPGGCSGARFGSSARCYSRRVAHLVAGRVHGALTRPRAGRASRAGRKLGT